MLWRLPSFRIPAPTFSCSQGWGPAGAGLGWREQSFSVSALDKGCYFSCHVCWGPAQVCFSCRKAGRPIWNTHNSHVIDDDLAQHLALAPWQLKGTGWASPCHRTEEQGKGGRMRDAYLCRPCRPLHSFPLLTPPSRDFWLRLTQSPASRALLFSGRLHSLSTSSSDWMHEEASHPKERKVWISRDPCSSLVGGRSRKREKEHFPFWIQDNCVALWEKLGVFPLRLQECW